MTKSFSGFPECSLSFTKIVQTSGKRACSLFPECSLSYTKIMQTSGKRACSLFPECSLSYTKIVQGECNGKWKSRSVFILCIAEPQLILYKDSANSPTYKTKQSVFDHPLIMCSYVCRLAVKPTIGNSLQRLGFSLCRFRDIILRE